MARRTITAGCRNGKVIARFEPAITPESADVTGAIEKALK
jgi:glutathione peroxidase-family protein